MDDNIQRLPFDRSYAIFLLTFGLAPEDAKLFEERLEPLSNEVLAAYLEMEMPQVDFFKYIEYQKLVADVIEAYENGTL